MEKIETDEEKFEKVKKLLEKENKKFNPNYIFRQLHEQVNLRKVFLAVIKNNPALVHEVYEDALLTKQTCYNYLHRLIDLRLVKRVFALNVSKGKENNEAVKIKFEDWISKMPEHLKRYFEAKTSFWEITEFGKKFAGRAYEFEQEFREEDAGGNETKINPVWINGEEKEFK